MTIALETKGLEKSFGGLRVTRDLSLRVEQGALHEPTRVAQPFGFAQHDGEAIEPGRGGGEFNEAIGAGVDAGQCRLSFAGGAGGLPAGEFVGDRADVAAIGPEQMAIEDRIIDTLSDALLLAREDGREDRRCGGGA